MIDNPFEIILSRLDEIESKISSQVPAAIQPPEIIDTVELCRRLAISEPTAIKWRRKKKIPSFRVGSSVRFNWTKVVDTLENQRSS